jgi:hypothetical protein
MQKVNDTPCRYSQAANSAFTNSQWTELTTSVSQPMDQGIIRNVEVHYRKLLMHSFLANMDCTSVVYYTALCVVPHCVLCFVLHCVLYSIMCIPLCIVLHICIPQELPHMYFTLVCIALCLYLTPSITRILFYPLYCVLSCIVMYCVLSDVCHMWDHGLVWVFDQKQQIINLRDLAHVNSWLPKTKPIQGEIMCFPHFL